MYKASLAKVAGVADDEREWEVGRRLHFLAEAQGSLPSQQPTQRHGKP